MPDRNNSTFSFCTITPKISIVRGGFLTDIVTLELEQKTKESSSMNFGNARSLTAMVAVSLHPCFSAITQ